MPDRDHPDWCSMRRCTAMSPPLNGHQLGVHRSVPEASGATELYLVQTPGAAVPAVELARAGRTFTVPLLEAQSLAPAVDDLLRQAGVGL